MHDKNRRGVCVCKCVCVAKNTKVNTYENEASGNEGGIPMSDLDPEESAAKLKKEKEQEDEVMHILMCSLSYFLRPCILFSCIFYWVCLICEVMQSIPSTYCV